MSLKLWDEWRVFAGEIIPAEELHYKMLLMHLPDEADIHPFIDDFSDNTSLRICEVLNISFSELVHRYGQESADIIANAIGSLAAEYALSHWQKYCANKLRDQKVRSSKDDTYVSDLLTHRWNSVPVCSLGGKLSGLPNTISIGHVCNSLLNAPHDLPLLLRFDLDAYCYLWQLLEDYELLPKAIRSYTAITWRESWLVRFPDSHGTRLSRDSESWISLNKKAVQNSRYWIILISRYALFVDASCGDSSNGYRSGLQNSVVGSQPSLGWRPEPLEAIGKRLGLSRERTRQLESAALKQFGCGVASTIVASLVSSLRWLINDAGGVLSLKDMAARMERLFDFSTPGLSPLGVCGLCLECSQSAISPLIRNQVYALPGLITPETYTELVREARLRRSLGEWSGFVHDAESLKGSISETNLSLPLLHACLRASGECITEGQTVGFYLPLRTLIVQALRDASHPLHFREVTAAINDMRQRKEEARVARVHNILYEDRHLFCCTGPGTYGLKEWGNLEFRETDRGKAYGLISDLIESLLLACKYPLTRDEIISQVLTQKRCRVTSIEQSLYRDPRFQKSGSRWGLTSWYEDEKGLATRGSNLTDKSQSLPKGTDEGLLELLFGDYKGSKSYK